MAFENIFVFLFAIAFFIVSLFIGKANIGGVVASPFRGVMEDESSFGKKSGIALFFIIQTLLWLSFFLIAFSLADPHTTEKKIRYLASGSSYFIVLDVSPSMAASKDEVTALERGKAAAQFIAEASGNDYPGLILFGSLTALTLLPTPDREAFLSRLNSAKIMKLGDATALGSALGEALYHLDKLDSAEKRVVLISDGGSNREELLPQDAAEIARGMRISINCIAIAATGTRGDSYFDRESVEIETEKGKVIGRIISGSNPDLLKNIASISGGYYLENPGEAALERMALSLKGKESTQEEIYFVKNSFARFFLLMGVALFFASMILKIFIIKELLS